VSARLALHYAKGEITDSQEIVIESILGAASAFTGRVVERTRVGAFDAIVPEVSGTAFLTGRHEFLLDPRDALGQGFLM
jgi:trans-L-3-hydroxyproline dehydratase